MNADQGLARDLLENVDSFVVNFFDGEQWNDFWPVNDGSERDSDNPNDKLPVAIKVSIELSDLGLIERLFVISDQQEP